MGSHSTIEYLGVMDSLSYDFNVTRDVLDTLWNYTKPIYRSEREKRFSEPMLWIGLYIAFASLVCILAMVADLFHGLRSRKHWFPCKFFRINAASLTVISVAMKLPVDLSGSMPGDVDQVAKLGSMAFMCTMMANLLPCLSTMESNELLSNVTALCLLVITMVVNVCIQIQTGVVSYKEVAPLRPFVSSTHKVKINKDRNFILASMYVTLLLLLLIVHVCSSLAILKSKKIIELKYKQVHDKAPKDIQSSPGGLPTVDQLQNHVSNHWIMAASGSPQFIIACSPTASASGVICLFVSIVHTFTVFWTTEAILSLDCDSDYSWSMIVVLIVQYIGVVIGTIAPLSRCFATVSFKVSSKIISNHFKVFEVENYWTSKLYDWKRASIKLSISRYSLKVVTETLKKLILCFCIDFQEGFVVLCKIINLIPFVLMICVMYCFRCLKWVLKGVVSSFGKKTNSWERYEDLEVEKGKDDKAVNRFEELRPYVLQLEDEMELAERTLEGLSKSMNKLIQKGEENKPKDLKDLIEKKSTRGFLGVEKFNQSITLLARVQYQDSWSLPVVTLTTIAISLCDNEVNSLWKSVRKGLEYVKLVEESLNVTDDFVSIRNEAEALWKEVDVDGKWLGNKLQLDPSSQVNTAREIVEWFRDTAKEIDYEEGRIGEKSDDSIHKSICANSMYCITKTILLTYHDNIERVSHKELFDHLSSMIADILAACLTNIPQVIIVKCHTSTIEKREDNVINAARLLGETKQIMEILPTHGIPGMSPSDFPFISKWRGYRESQIA